MKITDQIIVTSLITRWEIVEIEISEDLKQMLYGIWQTLGTDIKGNELENDYAKIIKELGIVQVDVSQDCARIFTADMYKGCTSLLILQFF